VVLFLKVASLVDKTYPYLSPDDLVTRARAVMRDFGVRVLPVITRGKLVGVVTRVGVLSITSTRSNYRVLDIAEEPRLTLDVIDDVVESVRKMIRADEWYVPVLSGGKYVGMFGLEDFMRYLLTYESPKHEIPVSEIMTREVETVMPETHVSRLWLKMLRHRFAGFPVVNKRGKVVGFVSQHDLIKAGFTRIELESESAPRKGPRVRNIMVTPPITLTPNEPIRTALYLMVRRNIGRIPIVDEKRYLKGIIDREDVCRVFI